MENLTEKQKEMLKFIEDYTLKNGLSPSYREMSDYFSISLGAVQDRVKSLKNKKILESMDGKSRSLRIKGEYGSNGLDYISIPVLGSIAAGFPILAEENIDYYINLPTKNFSKSGNYFALKVDGDSMIDEGIMNGDTAIIRSTDKAVNGKIVAASVGEKGMTLKTFFKETNRIKLMPANKDYKPIYSQDVTIHGVLTTILRNYE